ncbi:unnamed protein product [Trichogramma brassicae]|uniref:Trafficking protein particle complex subunit 6B n=1 Tax=Trichogramma brassicae TaxID=86971 RepID=A0A6H5IYI1_9HYME|nr:unnamed protein product [Trichogramma brassicae]
MKHQFVDGKSAPGAKAEADECLFEYLHGEIINYVVSKSKESSEEDLSQLEWMGFSVGYRIIERLTREMQRFKDELDIIKFICTDFWNSLYHKQVDNLRTNHHGVYVLHDNEFRLLAKIGKAGSRQYLCESPRLLAFTCGLLRGSLANLGVACTVKAEVTALPSCKFNVEVQRM